MIEFKDLKPDCRHFLPDRPCAPHKQFGSTCPQCDHYDPCARRILVVKLAALGDVLRTTSMLPAIREKYPDAHVTWITANNACALFGGNALVDEVWPAGSAITVARLQATEFDLVMCPDADAEAAALAAIARAGERIGFTLDARGRVIPIDHHAETWFRMGLSDRLKRANRETYQVLIARLLGLDPAAVGLPMLAPTEAERMAAAKTFESFGFSGRYIGLNTGAGERWEFKQWTFEHQRAFVQRAASEGAAVVLLGGQSERARHRELCESIPDVPVFDAGTGHSVGRFAAMVERCDVMVSGDTFAMHVACARKTPVVVLFGPTSAVEIDLYGNGTKILPEELDCLGCYLPRCDVVPHCQARIMPDTVWDAVRAHFSD